MPNTLFQPLTANAVEYEKNCRPLLLTAHQAAAICSISVRNWRIWDSAGKVPRPIRIGRARLWRVNELHAWVAAGCPRRDAWEKMQDNLAFRNRSE
jgi:predicted DNA-binding transcriptional regulator AlpA